MVILIILIAVLWAALRYRRRRRRNRNPTTVVDLAARPAHDGPAPRRAFRAPRPHADPGGGNGRSPLIGRWAVLVVAVGIGFHATLVSAVTQSYNGDPLDYLFLLPLWGFVLVLGTHCTGARSSRSTTARSTGSWPWPSPG